MVCCIKSKSLLLFLLLCYLSDSFAVSVQMRVVKDTASYGYFGPNVGGTENNVIYSSIPPSNFSGPLLLEKLIGKCYNFTQEQYRYSFCPFKNFSQFELSSRWNAYHGILGIWSHWNIQNYTFKSMMYTHGDQCGDIQRSVEVYLQCGLTETLFNVTEPQKCCYSAIFSSKYLCHNDSLLVYPRLPTHLQRKWDQLWTEYNLGYITQKGYDLKLKKLFEAAGFFKKTSREAEKVVIPTAHFTDIFTCNKEYQSVVKEVSRLNQQVDEFNLLLDLAKLEKPRH